MTSYIFLNDKIVPYDQALVGVEDRGYVFSDGVYEVMWVTKKNILNFTKHMDRFKNSLTGLRIDYKLDPSWLQQSIITLIEKNNLEDAIIYVQITRGVAQRDHAFPKPAVKPTIWMKASPTPALSGGWFDGGAKVILRPDIRWKMRHLKTISLLPNILAKQEAVEHDAVEAILVEEDNTITEGSSTNVFMVDKKDVIWTHPANHMILGGITRSNVIEVAKKLKLDLREEAFDVKSFKQAKEVFITSTTKRILPITAIESEYVGDGKVGTLTKQLIEGIGAYYVRKS